MMGYGRGMWEEEFCVMIGFGRDMQRRVGEGALCDDELWSRHVGGGALCDDRLWSGHAMSCGRRTIV